MPTSKKTLQTNTSDYDVAIIGGGPAAYTAALYTSRASLKTVLLTGDTPGGQLLLTSEVENFPGFPDGIMGPELMEKMKLQATKFGAVLQEDYVESLNIGQVVQLMLADRLITAQTVIIATGAQAQWLGLPNETRLMGKGISACATCDGYFFRDKTVVVVGGGDSAMEEALTLTHFATKVIIVVRRHQLRASQIMQTRAKQNKKIEFIWESVVTDVFGDSFVEAVEITNLASKQVSHLKCQGLFVAIGHTPATVFIKDVIKLDAKGYIEVQDNVFTSQPNIFAAGDVADPKYRQAITAAGDGCRAALEAEKWLANQAVNRES